MGGEEPFPAVPPRSGLPQARRRAKHQERARRRTDHGGRDRRARLGARDARQSLHRPDGRRGDDLRARRRARELSRAGRPPGRNEDRRRITAGDLRLGVRRRRGPAAHLHGPLRRGSPHPPALWQDDQRHGRCQQSGRAAAARHRASGRARSADRGPWRLHCGRRGESRPAGHAVGRGLLLPPLRDGQRVLPAGPCDLHRRSLLRSVNARVESSCPSGLGLARAG